MRFLPLPACRLCLALAPLLLTLAAAPARAINPGIPYDALGDSLTAGVGASTPGTTDYVPQVRTFLNANRGTFTLNNRGISGAVAPALAGSPGTPSVERDELTNAENDLPRVVTLTVGGNDVLHIVGFDPGAETVADYDTSLNNILAGLRGASSNPFVVLTNVPDLTRLPAVANSTTPAQKAVIQAVIGQINTSIATRAAQYAIPVVDIFSDPRTYDPANISGDGFHPNDAGYTVLASLFTATMGSPRVVGNTNDAGPASLRQTLTDADRLPAADTVVFDPTVFGTTPQTITLTSGELTVASDVTMTGPGAKFVAVSGNNASRVLSVSAGIVSVRGLTVTGGNGAGALQSTNGGGVLDQAATLTLTDCVVSGNSAGIGAGLACLNGGFLTLKRSTVANNTASFGAGGLYNSGAALALGNCTVANNTAPFDGGIGSSGALNLNNCTITGNSMTGNISGFAGGVRNGSGTVTVTGCLIAGNTSGATGNPDVNGAFTSGDSNLIGKTDGSTGFTAAHDQTGTVASPLNPGLDASLQDNGGPTPTIALLRTSPAVDGDFNASVPVVDQRILGRPMGVRADIGAFELDIDPPVTTPSLTGPSYFNGFWRGPVTVRFTTQDVTGPVSTFFRVDSGPQQTYGGPFTVSGDFQHLVTFYSIDGLGNAEGPAKSVTFSIDTTPPTTTLTSRVVSGGREVTLKNTDNFSGPGGTFYRIDSGPQRAYTGPFVVTGNFQHLITAYSIDRAANAETSAKSLTFTNP